MRPTKTGTHFCRQKVVTEGVFLYLLGKQMTCFFIEIIWNIFGRFNETKSWKRSVWRHGWPVNATLQSNDYSDVIISAMASQFIGVSVVFSAICSSADQSKHQSSAPMAFVGGIHGWPVDSPLKWPVTRKMFPFDDLIMNDLEWWLCRGSPPCTGSSPPTEATDIV